MALGSVIDYFLRRNLGDRDTEAAAASGSLVQMTKYLVANVAPTAYPYDTNGFTSFGFDGTRTGPNTNVFGYSEKYDGTNSGFHYPGESYPHLISGQLPSLQVFCGNSGKSMVIIYGSRTEGTLAGGASVNNRRWSYPGYTTSAPWQLATPTSHRIKARASVNRVSGFDTAVFFVGWAQLLSFSATTVDTTGYFADQVDSGTKYYGLAGVRFAPVHSSSWQATVSNAQGATTGAVTRTTIPGGAVAALTSYTFDLTWEATSLTATVNGQTAIVSTNLPTMTTLEDSGFGMFPMIGMFQDVTIAGTSGSPSSHYFIAQIDYLYDWSE